MAITLHLMSVFPMPWNVASDPLFFWAIIWENWHIYWLNHTEEDIKTGFWKEFDSTTGSLFYTYSHLTERDFKFYRELPISRRLIFAGLPQITICHGSPYKVSEKLLPDDGRTFEIMEQTNTPFILCGHTHRQGKIIHNRKFILNAGAVGVPLESNGKSGLTNGHHLKSLHQ